MQFSEFARSLEALENTSSRLEMYELLGALFDKADVDEISPIAYLTEGRLLPAFEGVETGMGERTAAISLATAAKCSPEDVTEASGRLGDLGLVAEELIPRSKRPRLSLTDVYQGLLGIARTTGRGSTEEKQKQLTALLKQATPMEGRYIIRLTLGRLRLGVAAPTIIEAVARREEDSKRARRIIERAYNICSDLGLVLSTRMTEGLTALEKLKVRVGSPVRPMPPNDCPVPRRSSKRSAPVKSKPSWTVSAARYISREGRSRSSPATSNEPLICSPTSQRPFARSSAPAAPSSMARHWR